MSNVFRKNNVKLLNGKMFLVLSFRAVNNILEVNLCQ